MSSEFEALFLHHKNRDGRRENKTAKIRAIRDRYIAGSEFSITSILAETQALDNIVNPDDLHVDAITSQMEEAFQLAFPGQDLTERLARLDGASTDDPFVIGTINNWKGKYFEILVRDRLNAGGRIGTLSLSDGQTAQLASRLNQPGWDLQVIDSNGTVDEAFQLKASGANQIARALRQYPDVRIIGTDETADQLGEQILASGFRNEEIESGLQDSVHDLLDSPAETMFETIAPGFPFLLIALTEGVQVLIGRRTFERALERSVDRGRITAFAMTAFVGANLLGAGPISLVAPAMVRVGIARERSFSDAAERVKANHSSIKVLLQQRSPVS